MTLIFQRTGQMGEPNRPTVLSYTIYHSPNAYLGVALVNRQLAGLPVIHIRRPIYVPRARGVRVADLVGGKESPARARYHREDCARWAKRHAMPLHFIEPSEFEARAKRWATSAYDREELPARMFYAAEELGRGAELDRAVFETAWVHGRDVNDEQALGGAAEAAGLDRNELLRRALEPGPGNRLRDALGEFDSAECPGVPTFVFQGQRFWGKDRVGELLEVIETALNRQAVGPKG